jgi:GTP-binding protein LepA
LVVQHNQPGSTDQSVIRNFCIIAHIDHGKSTVADRILQLSGIVPEREMRDRFLDRMDIEQERGITIKSQAVRVPWTFDGTEYTLGMIDTPGHVDFTYEVSRALAACEGAVLVVDASQGVEAQTLANCYLALDHDLEVVPILNKIDLPSADPDAVAKEVEDVIGLPCMEAPRVSAKLGIGVKDVLECVVRDIPGPTGDPDKPLKALIFDSIYDSYKGVIVYVRVFDGTVKPGDTIRLMSTGAEFQLVEVGRMGATQLSPCEKLEAGEVGYLTASIKTVRDTRVGDTVTLANNPTPEPMPGFRTVTPMVFCGIYPADGADYPDLKDALEKLQLNDASLSFEPETSAALGFGFRCGFLGLLHMEIITERLEREFDLDLITTTPGVQYRLTLTDGTVEVIDNPSAYPDPTRIVKSEEPFVNAHIYTPNDYVGPLMDLCQAKRGVLIDMKYMDETRVDLHYQIPLGEIVYDFFDAIKSRSRGYASYDYEWEDWHESKLVRLDFLLNGEVVDALSMIVFADNAYAKGRRICEKLKENIPRALFEIPIQAAVGGKVIARETVKAMRKDVLAKCYGGDITRKKKLLEKQKEGKKKMRQLGSVTLPSEAFTAVLKLDSDS